MGFRVWGSEFRMVVQDLGFRFEVLRIGVEKGLGFRV